MKRRDVSYDLIWGQLRGRGVPGSRIRVGRCLVCNSGWVWDRRDLHTHLDGDGGILVRWHCLSPRGVHDWHRPAGDPHLEATYLACPDCHGQHDMGSQITQLRRTTCLANVHWRAYPAA